MATKKVEEKEEIASRSRKKIATGNTEKIVKKRTSSVTNKEKNTATQKESTKKQKESKKTSTKSANKNSNKTPREKKSTNNEKTVLDSKKNKDSKITEPIKNKKTKIKSNKNLKIDIEKVQDVIEKEAKSKQIPKEEQDKINNRVFQNIFIAIIIMFYLNFIILGFINIENDIFLVDLKVFGLSILVISIGIFEYAYKKDSGIYTIHGIEALILALCTIGFIYLDIMYKNKFIPIVILVAYIFSIYYIAKAIIIYKKLKKQYFMNNIKEIIKRKED